MKAPNYGLVDRWRILAYAIREGQFEINVNTLQSGLVKVTCETQAKCRDALVACLEQMILEEMGES